jgi:PilZ domain
VEKFKPCPYCGVLFSGKYGTEKRKQSRIKREIPFVIAYNGQNIEACTLDVSDNGICLKIFGSPSLPVGETIDFNVNDINVKAQVMWVTNNSKISSAITGLQIVDGTVSTL